MELFAPAHLLIILLIALLLFGGKKLPELARGIGTSMAELRKGMDSGQAEVKKETVVAAQQPSVNIEPRTRLNEWK